MTGIDLASVERLRAATDLAITVAGGITTIEEICTLSRLGLDVQLGMSLYTGRISLAQAFIEALNWKSDLLPTITQNKAGQVLMLGYSNRASLERTFLTNSMHYYSRSRGRLWMKGETSGHVQTVIRLRADCDRDTVLATVDARGPACHLGTDSCFGDLTFTLTGLRDQIQTASRREPATGAESTRDEIVKDAADCLETMAVRLVDRGVTFEQVLRELKSRYWRRRCS